MIAMAITGNYAGISIEYRLTGEAKWPAQIHDCRAAIRWIREAMPRNTTLIRITSACGALPQVVTWYHYWAHRQM